MQRLSKNEVVELVQEAIREQQNLMGYDANKFARVALDALETNGILCLVEGEAKEGDTIQEAAPEPYEPEFYEIHEWTEIYGKYKIIQRNNTAVYHCERGE